MWALVLVAMVGMAGQLAVFQTWLPRLKRFQSHPQLLYAFVNVVVINIVSWLGGFSAWALVTTVLCLVNIAVAIAYAIITRRHERRNAKHGAVVPDGTSQYGRYLEYNECPRPFSKRQRKGMIASTVVLVGAGAAFLLTLFVFWRIPPYKVCRAALIVARWLDDVAHRCSPGTWPDPSTRSSQRWWPARPCSPTASEAWPPGCA